METEGSTTTVDSTEGGRTAGRVVDQATTAAQGALGKVSEVTRPIVDRAAALLDGDYERVRATAPAFETAGCPYQRARTLILAAGDTAPAGNAALVDLGLSSAAGGRAH